MYTFPYFAYGSNMSQSRLEKRVGPVTLIGVAKLNNYVMKYSHVSYDGTGKCNVLKEESVEVIGILYDLSIEQLKKLDRYEGAPDVYKRKVLKVKIENGSSYNCIVYISTQLNQKFARPTSGYLYHLLRGCIEHNIDNEYCQKYVIQETQIRKLVQTKKIQQTMRYIPENYPHINSRGY